MHSIPRGTSSVSSVGQTSGSAADVPVGLSGVNARFAERVREDRHRPGGLPHLLRLLLLAVAPLAAQEIKLPPNFGAHAIETVDVSLGSDMLQAAAKFLSAGKPDEAQAKKTDRRPEIHLREELRIRKGR